MLTNGSKERGVGLEICQRDHFSVYRRKCYRMPGSYVAEPQGKGGGKDVCMDVCVGGTVVCRNNIVKFIARLKEIIEWLEPRICELI